ncbi:photosynthetic complex assembly protein [Gemmatimonadetes bacterium T265]|nr:photosynthetic complex assembly protein [Gemmatimonadetes bacterium T265]
MTAARLDVVRRDAVRVDTDGRTWLPGVGEPLPAGERVRWVGRPDPAALARRAFHVRGLAAYFALLAALTFAVRSPAVGAAVAAADALTVAAMGAAVLAFAGVYAALVARATLYAVTDRRVVVRAGVAVPAVLNVPLDRVASVDLRRGRDGAGDVEVTLGGDVRVAYLLLWPHARPWHVTRPRPTFRGVRDADAAGVALAQAVRAAQGPGLATPESAEPAEPPRRMPAPAPHAAAA